MAVASPDADLSTDRPGEAESSACHLYREPHHQRRPERERSTAYPLPCESRTYELTGYEPAGPAGRFQAEDFVQPMRGQLEHLFDSELGYEEAPTTGRERRLIEEVRTLYRPTIWIAGNDPMALLPLGSAEPLALPGETYQLAFTSRLISQLYTRPRPNQPGQPDRKSVARPAGVLPADVSAGKVADRGGYVDLEGDGNWWMPSGRVFYSPDPADTRHSGARPCSRITSSCHIATSTLLARARPSTYDPYDLLLAETRDSLGNRVTVGERDA